MKLTKEQQKIVTDNHNLIYKFAHDRGLDLEEWYGDLAIQLCKSVKAHNPEKGKLSTLYYFSCDNLIKMRYRNSQSLKNKIDGLYSLDYVYSSEDGEGMSLHQVIEDDLDLEELVESSMIVEDMLNGKYGEIVKLRLKGYSQIEISEILGISQSIVSRRLLMLKKMYFKD